MVWQRLYVVTWRWSATDCIPTGDRGNEESLDLPNCARGRGKPLPRTPSPISSQSFSNQ